jgi:hypothetical protein
MDPTDEPQQPASSIFAGLIRRAAQLTDAFDDYCVHCRRMTKWVFQAWMAGRKYYACARCGCQKSGKG